MHLPDESRNNNVHQERTKSTILNINQRSLHIKNHIPIDNQMWIKWSQVRNQKEGENNEDLAKNTRLLKLRAKITYSDGFEPFFREDCRGERK